MTYYSITDNQREYIHYGIAAISMGLSGLLLTFDIDFIHKVIVPSGFLIYGLLILLFDKVLWKTKAFKWLIGVPNLNGTWQGINNIKDGRTETLNVTITQTWRKIDVVVRTTETISNIVSATFNIDNSNIKSLKYIWTIKPVQPSPTVNYYGEGFTELRIQETNGILKIDGNYYSSKLSSGHFTLEKQ